MKKLILSLLAVVAIAILTLLYIYYETGDIKNKGPKVEFPKMEDNVETTRIKLIATGDIMFHQPTYKYAYDKEKGEYDFTSFYEKVSEDLKGADFSFANLESPINPNRPLGSFPIFNAPAEALKYLKAAGFDGLSTANNHCIDAGFEGILTTIDELDKNAFFHFGTRKNPDEMPPIKEIKGIKIGFIAYSEIFNGMEGLVPSDKKYAISPVDYEKIKSDISYLKSKECDIIIAMPHYGIEYRTEPSNSQIEISKFLVENGVDLVLGSHPHVLERAGMWEENGKNKFIIYSMGNSISNQRQPWMGSFDTEMGVLVEIDVEKGKSTNFHVNLVPTCVIRKRENDGFRYYVYKMRDLLDGGKFASEIDDKEREKVSKMYIRAKEILGEKYVK